MTKKQLIAKQMAKFLENLEKALSLVYDAGEQAGIDEAIGAVAENDGDIGHNWDNGFNTCRSDTLSNLKALQNKK